jgi:hypothetical protein
MPEVLPSPIVTVDGETVEMIQDFQGDVLNPTNSYLWIPSPRAVIAGDVVFNDVHVWLGRSNPQSRRAWHNFLQLIETLRPLVVVAGHKRSAELADSPAAVATMLKYVDDFDTARKASSSPDRLVTVMKCRHPDWVQEELVVSSARTALAPAVQK